MAGNKCAEHGYTHEECECSVWALPWKVSPPALVTHDELPAWAQDNEYIVAHYRPVFQDWRKCVHSWFYLHNQSGNIYSHMIAFVCFVGLYINTWTGIYRETGCMSDVLSLLPAALGGLGVLFFSTLFHTMRCNCEADCNNFNKLDYCGIVLSTWGTGITFTINLFRCNPLVAFGYCLSNTICAMSVVFVLLNDDFGHSKYRHLRPIPFTVHILSSAYTLTTYIYVLLAYLNGRRNCFLNFACACTCGFTYLSVLLDLAVILHVYNVGGASLYPEALQEIIDGQKRLALCFLTGAVFFVSRIPECFYPGSFDLWGQSHQIFHLLINAGLYYTFEVTVAANRWGHALSSCGGERQCLAGF